MPDWKTLVAARVGPLPLDPVRAADIVDELAQHAAEHYRELVAGGADDAAATERALRPLADRARLAVEIARADRPRPAAPEPPAREARWWSGTLRDARYAVRLLGRAPAFTAVVLVTLAVGIGANTAIFSIIDSVLLTPLPFANPDRLVRVGERGSDGRPGNVGFTTFLDWRDRSHSFEAMGLIRSWLPTVNVNGEPERVPGMRVSSNYFRMLGISPAVGRDFQPQDDTQAGSRVVLLSDGLWRRRFNADPGISGRVVTINDLPFTVIGVLPRSYEPLISQYYYQPAEMWAPLGYDTTLRQACRSCQHLKAIGRLKAGADVEAARRDVEAVQQQLRLDHPAEYERGSMTVVPLSDELTGGVRPALLVLLAAVGCVLLITCVNVANLFLGRVAQRERDMGLRAALGAGRAQLVRQLLVESLVLGVAGAALGLLLCAWGVPLLSRIAPANLPRLADAAIDARVFFFCLGLAVVTALVFGLIPALRASRVDLQTFLQGDGRRTGRASTSPARRVLIAVEVTLAVVLLTGAGLMIKSVGRLLDVDPGFKAGRVLTLQASLIGSKFATTEQVLTATDQILAKLRALPGVEAAATSGQIPLGGNGDSWGFHIRSRPAASPADDPSVERYSVTPDYFSVMGIPLLRGRLLSPADRTDSDAVMLVGAETARRLWPASDPIGERVSFNDAKTGPWRTIVGVVGDVRHEDLASPPRMEMYIPQAQFTDAYLTFVLRTAGDPGQIASEARRTIMATASSVPVYNVATMSELVTRSAGPRQFVMLLLTLFSAIALLMTAVGVYGVIAFSVAERTREIGIRSALGASRPSIIRLVLGSGLSTVAIGLGVGVGASLATTRYLEGSLYGVSARDPVVLTVSAAVLFAVAVMAHAVPILRALRVEPTVALRQF